jgi:O-antigen/teichoic acid export membrane protein
MNDPARVPRSLSASGVLRGAGFVTLSTLADHLLPIAVMVVLVRLVTPDAIGLVLLATTITETVSLLRPGGTGFALTHQGHRAGELLRSALLIQVSLGIIATALQLLTVPLIAGAFQKPALQPLLTVLSLTHLPAALLTIVQAVLSIDFAFGRSSWVTLASAAVGSVGQVALGAVELGVVLLGARCLLSGRLAWSAATEMVRFRRHVFAADELSYLNHSLDYLILGRLVSSASLGAYGLAYNMAHASRHSDRRHHRQAGDVDVYGRPRRSWTLERTGKERIDVDGDHRLTGTGDYRLRTRMGVLRRSLAPSVAGRLCGNAEFGVVGRDRRQCRRQA